MPAGRIIFADGGVWDSRDRTRLFGILNVTPDSFFDGGTAFDEAAAAERAATMIEDGAHAVDIGGESTRPGASRISEEEELRRILPVVRRVRREHPGVRISVDTTRSGVARAAIEEGADIINDISAMTFDAEMPATVARAEVPCVLMHMKGDPRTMQNEPGYDDVMSEITSFLAGALETAGDAGVAPEKTVIDPGIGFGKTVDHNLAILRRLPELACLERPILVGASRKSFIGALAGGAPPGERLEGSLAAASAAVLGGAAFLRVHDVAETARLLRVTDAVSRG